jgi:hypothetical protein
MLLDGGYPDGSSVGSPDLGGNRLLYAMGGGVVARGTEVSRSARNELWRLANGMCHKCRHELDTGTKGGTPTAQVAHIVALSDGGPRSVPDMAVEAKNDVSNLLLLCSTCHDVVDKNNGQRISAEQLRNLKADHEAVWSTHSITGLDELLRIENLAFAAVRGLRRRDLEDLHEVLLESSASYRGAIEMKLDRPMHQYCYGLFPRFRLVDSDLRLRYSASEYYGDKDWDNRPHWLVSEWEATRWFKSVSWEEDPEE